jgi:hypothetical protein
MCYQNRLFVRCSDCSHSVQRVVFGRHTLGRRLGRLRLEEIADGSVCLFCESEELSVTDTPGPYGPAPSAAPVSDALRDCL